MDLEQLVGLETESLETEHTVYELFKWSLILKGAISVAEVIAGTLLLLIPVQYVIDIVQHSSVVLSGYSDTAITDHIVAELAQFTAGSAIFVALYLLSRGLIKCFLIAGLLKNRMWAYPVSLGVLALFLLYQAHDIITKGSVFVMAITLFDLVVMYFIWREWRIVRRHQSVAK